MASLGHVAVALAAARVHEGRFNWRAAVALSAFSLLPDLDVIGFRFGVAYLDPLGHRGASHSITFALLCGVIAFALTRSRKSTLILFLVVLSHPLLDMLTDGGGGVSLFWPLSTERYFFPWRPLPVAPLGSRMLSARGFQVLAVEAVAFFPLWLYGLWPNRKQVTP